MMSARLGLLVPPSPSLGGAPKLSGCLCLSPLLPCLQCCLAEFDWESKDCLYMGTVDYSSVRSLYGHHQCAWDDLEALAVTLLEMATGAARACMVCWHCVSCFNTVGSLCGWWNPNTSKTAAAMVRACGLHLQPAMSAACWLTPIAMLCCMLCTAGCVPFDLLHGDDLLTAERLQQMAAQKEQQWQKLLCNVSCAVSM